STGSGGRNRELLIVSASDLVVVVVSCHTRAIMVYIHLRTFQRYYIFMIDGILIDNQFIIIRNVITTLLNG
ncbi:hypothetical protein LINPERPRIM_LOCUS38393, partial [Linum perenne]